MGRPRRNSNLEECCRADHRHLSSRMNRPIGEIEGRFPAEVIGAIDQNGQKLLLIPIKDIDTGIVLLNSPDMADFQVKQCTSHDLDHYLVCYQNNIFANVLAEDAPDRSHRPRSNCFQIFPTGNIYQVRCRVP